MMALFATTALATTAISQKQVRGHTIYTFIAILRRDLWVTTRELVPFLLRVLIQPMLFLFIFGYVLPKINIVSVGFTVLIVPGIVAMSMMMAAMQGVTLPLVIELGLTRELDDRILSPISPNLVAIEKIIMGTLQSLIAGAVVFPIAWAILGSDLHVDFSQPLLLAGIALLVGVGASSLGMTLGTAVEPSKTMLVFSLILTPMIALGCTYYPWATLDTVGWFQKVVLINPLVYASEGFRAALAPAVPHMDVTYILIGLSVTVLLFLWLGLKGFVRRIID